MKREGHIIEEIIERSNLEDSFDSVVRGTLRKKLREGKWLIAHRASFLDSVAKEIESGFVSLRPWHEKHIVEAEKARDIQVFCMADRIKINAVMSVVDKHLHKRYIRTTGASIKRRGMHDLMQYIRRDLKEDPTIRYWYKSDVQKCYDTVIHHFVKFSLLRVFKDKRLLDILFSFIDIMPGGVKMSMGMRSSQGLVNLLFSVFIDHVLKDRERLKHFYRYMDDSAAGGPNKRGLWHVRDIEHEQVNSIGQKIKPNERVFPIESGLDFLGYVIFPTHTLMRKRIKKNFARKLAKVKSRKRRVQIVGSFYGIAKHANCRNLMKKLLTPKEMRDFSELNHTYTPSDGKKRFPNKATQLRQLVNVVIEILDFERDVKTKYGNRWLVMYRDPRTNETSKFFTDCDEMKQALETAQAADFLPFRTIIKAEYFGDNKVKYKFTSAKTE
ncbi:reverse transcriptase domain-containing protein [Duncaniella dubosii]|uniref:reverse transcriptase domain-containing protein n=1 Tax=Duncaniella dubosii TaxID=2518971 RepID=UPI0023F45582|nr:reverse transcriptase domain-containing protein [Duncaniella dubosii]MCX4285229.1 reverse transcriptase domain-containing protein [Duncaniella dubosii]